jgi:hypothetical protein
VDCFIADSSTSVITPFQLRYETDIRNDEESENSPCGIFDRYRFVFYRHVIPTGFFGYP